mmetsp:Transcript_110213/g.351270  ORF Transcript_110213/g.351270 Transcript_110213/m.351270 type:complete len:282 (+) Transcript_110213:212-1057(+)
MQSHRRHCCPPKRETTATPPPPGRACLGRRRRGQRGRPKSCPGGQSAAMATRAAVAPPSCPGSCSGAALRTNGRPSQGLRPCPPQDRAPEKTVLPAHRKWPKPACAAPAGRRRARRAAAAAPAGPRPAGPEAASQNPLVQTACCCHADRPIWLSRQDLASARRQSRPQRPISGKRTSASRPRRKSVRPSRPATCLDPAQASAQSSPRATRATSQPCLKAGCSSASAARPGARSSPSTGQPWTTRPGAVGSPGAAATTTGRQPPRGRRPRPRVQRAPRPPSM